MIGHNTINMQVEKQLKKHFKTRFIYPKLPYHKNGSTTQTHDPISNDKSFIIWPINPWSIIEPHKIHKSRNQSRSEVQIMNDLVRIAMWRNGMIQNTSQVKEENLQNLQEEKKALG